MLTLASGALLGHGITALSLLVLARLYSPNDFGLLSVYGSIVMVIASGAGLRYDIALAVPAQTSVAKNLAVAALTSGLIFGTLISTVGLAATYYISATNINCQLCENWWIVGIGVTITVASTTALNWALREKRYTDIARSRAAQSGCTAIFQMAAGCIAPGPMLLIVGHQLGFVVGTFSLFRNSLHRLTIPESLRRLNLREIRNDCDTYKNYPKYSVWEALFNSCSAHVPLLIISVLAGTAEFGFLMMAMSIVQAPMSLLGSSIGQVYLSDAARRIENGTLGELTEETLKKLLHLVPAIAVIGAFAPLYTSHLLGAEWARTGTLLLWLTPWFMTQFLATPITSAMQVTGNQRLGMWLQIAGFFLRSASIWIAPTLNLDAILVFSLSSTLFYLCILAAVVNISSCRPTTVLKNSRMALVSSSMIFVAAALLGRFL